MINRMQPYDCLILSGYLYERSDPLLHRYVMLKGDKGVDDLVVEKTIIFIFS